MKKKVQARQENGCDLPASDSGMKRRSAERRKRIVANRASGFREAEKWDLEFWQSQAPEQRLSALVAIRRDVVKVKSGRLRLGHVKRDKP